MNPLLRYTALLLCFTMAPALAYEDKYLDANGVKALAELPSLDELRARLLGTIKAPAGKLVRTINEPGSALARLLQAKIDKEGKAA